MVPFSHTYWQQTKLCTEAHVPTPRYGQYLTHAHNHITPAVAAMDSCFALFGAYQRGITVGSMSGEKTRVPKTLNCRGGCKAKRRAKQLLAAATAGVIWLCACVRYWPYRRVGTCASVHNLVPANNKSSCYFM